MQQGNDLEKVRVANEFRTRNLLIHSQALCR